MKTLICLMISTILKLLIILHWFLQQQLHSAKTLQVNCALCTAAAHSIERQTSRRYVKLHFT
jgi:hypothetical protein